MAIYNMVSKAMLVTLVQLQCCIGSMSGIHFKSLLFPETHVLEPEFRVEIAFPPVAHQLDLAELSSNMTNHSCTESRLLEGSGCMESRLYGVAAVRSRGCTESRL